MCHMNILVNLLVSLKQSTTSIYLRSTHVISFIGLFCRMKENLT